MRGVLACKVIKKILQGLGVSPGSVTERWSKKAEKRWKIPGKSFLFRTKIKIAPRKHFFIDIPSDYAKIRWKTEFQPREFPRSG